MFWCAARRAPALQLATCNLQDLDLFSSHKLVRDVSAELFEKTLPGAWISVMGGLLMLLLFVAELHGYFTPSWTSEIVMADDDPTADNLLPISFDVSMPRVPCQYASVDVMDTLGRRRINITERVQRFKIDVNGGVLGSADPDPEPPAYGHVDHKDGEVLAEQLNVDSFESMLKSSELAMVNFYAPWCHWSRKLQPVWEHTAGILHDVDTGVKFGRVSALCFLVACVLACVCVSLSLPLCLCHSVSASECERVF